MSISIGFLHGWGQSSRIWQNQAAYFSRFSSVRTIHLPGHGGSTDAPPEEWLNAIAAQLPKQPTILVGWSLGGMLAMQLAKTLPERVAALALVSTTPCFHARADWPHGCAANFFRTFELGVSKHSRKQLRRFFSMMLNGDELPINRFNELARSAIDREHQPTMQGLMNGLSLLAELDLRSLLLGLSQPAWVAHGAEDSIVPLEAGRHLAEKLPNAVWRPIEHCGHAPFLTQAELFNSELEAWCRNISHVNG